MDIIGCMCLFTHTHTLTHILNYNWKCSFVFFVIFPDNQISVCFWSSAVLNVENALNLCLAYNVYK